MDLINLSHFLKDYPEVSLAGDSDNEGLLEFFETTPMSGKSLELDYLRSPDFFVFIKNHSKDFFVFLLKDEKGEIQGSGTLVLRPAYVKGSAALVGYLGDLRFKKSRLVASVWRKFYHHLLNEMPRIEEFSQVKYLYTCILEDNKKALLALQGKKYSFGYHLFHKYHMVNIFYRMAPASPSKFWYGTWGEVDKKDLWEFFKTSNLSRPLGFVFESTHNEILWRETYWSGFDSKQSIVIKKGKEIIAAAHYWSPSPIKKIRLKKIPWWTQMLLKLASRFVNLPTEGDELKVLYVCGLSLRPALGPEEMKDCVRLIINRGLEIKKALGFHCVSLAQFDCSDYSAALSPYIHDKTALNLFLVDPRRDPTNDFDLSITPAFEMSLV